MFVLQFFPVIKRGTAFITIIYQFQLSYYKIDNNRIAKKELETRGVEIRTVDEIAFLALRKIFQ